MEHQRAGRLTSEVRRFALMLTAAALLIVVIVSFRVVYLATVTAPAAARLQADLLALAESDRAVLDADSAVRSYLATGDAAFAERARRDLPLTRSAEDEDAASDNPDRRRALVALVRAEQQWQTGWVDPALATVPGAPAADGALREGTDLLDGYLGASATVRSAALADATSVSRVATASSWVAGSSVAAIGLGSLVLALRWRRRLERNVVDPVDGLLASVHDIARGRLQEPKPVSGATELVELRDGLAEMTRALRHQREDSVAQAGRLRAQGDGLRTVLEMAREIAGSLNSRYVITSTVAATAGVTGGPVLLWLLDDEGGGLELAFDSERGPVPPLERQCSLGLGLVGRCAKYGQVTRADADGHDEGAVAVPLVVGARVTGVLECLGGTEGPPGEEALSSVEMLATLAGSAIEASRLHAATERLSQFDPLTQLGNRRRLEPDLDGAVANALRHGHAMSVIMIDLDHFKALNDRYGHQQGDVVLQEVASTMQATMRVGETAYRYGGEEFAVLVAHGNGDEAAVLAERLRARVESEFHRGGRQLVTASFGIASLPADADEAGPLVAAADRALYAAKNAGRNRVRRAVPVADRAEAAVGHVVAHRAAVLRPVDGLPATSTPERQG